ncbi:YdcF family protein [Candidimonas humi]|uniref:YdcF family protein n=1 Tax=Candidimonas humi TaxID=683355 RepID=A0ABV8NU92_9BURK|nr:YdcF family protein [Candidimonas humi]MBV6305092.1 YdcF family protein [Candidimonas humi]
MSASLIFTKSIALFLLFPGNLLFALLLALFLLKTRRRAWGLGVLWVCVLMLVVLAMPVVGQKLVSTVETVPPIAAAALPPPVAGVCGASGEGAELLAAPDAPAAPRAIASGPLQGAQAIVVISGDIDYHQAEYGGGSAGPSTLERIRYAAYLYCRSALPILVSGGIPVEGVSSADVMRRELTGLFRVPVRWAEGRSQNTAQNARYSWSLLHSQGIDTVVLVTSATHMPRALESFKRAGFRVIAAPTGFDTPPVMGLLDYIPQMSGLGLSNTALHEWIGRLWYDLRGM